jgi:hypothetical protein
MDWRTCSPGEVGAVAAQSVDGRGRGSKPSTTRITHRLDPSWAPHVRLWAPLGLDNPLAGRVGEGASLGPR